MTVSCLIESLTKTRINKQIWIALDSGAVSFPALLGCAGTSCSATAERNPISMKFIPMAYSKPQLFSFLSAQRLGITGQAGASAVTVRCFFAFLVCWMGNFDLNFRAGQVLKLNSCRGSLRQSFSCGTLTIN